MECTLKISAKHVACRDGALEHMIAPNRECLVCGLSIDKLDCPAGACERVYSHNVEIIDGQFHRRWICRNCLKEGSTPMPEAREYQILKGRLAAFKSGVLAITNAYDGPRPVMSVEFPKPR